MPKVSVIIPVYNHGPYIEQAIRGVLSQKVDFDMEVFIGDDCSKDDSRDVLERIQKDCPDYFHFIFREKNLGAKGNIEDLFSRISGEYFIILEGDDYWTYEYKLQKQVDFMDSNPEYILCSHNTVIVDENSNIIKKDYPECKEEEYTLYMFRCHILPGQTATNLYRNYYKIKGFDFGLEDIEFTAGDRRRAFECVTQGKVHCIQESWSCYRYITKGGTSFSSNNKQDEKTRNIVINYYDEMTKFAMKHKNDEALLAAEELYYTTLFSSIIRGKKAKDVFTCLSKFIRCRHKKSVLKYLLSKGKQVDRR